MKTQALVTVLFTALSLACGTGCAAGGSAQTMAAKPVSANAHVERRVLADGVEIVISEEAGVEARRIVEDFQSEMRSRYMSAR